MNIFVLRKNPPSRITPASEKKFVATGMILVVAAVVAINRSEHVQNWVAQNIVPLAGVTIPACVVGFAWEIHKFRKGR